MVIEGDDRIDGRYLDVHQGILSLLARQSPVASDLRLVAALLHTIMHIERVGDLAVNIAKLVPLMGEAPDGAGEIMAKLEAAANQARDQLKQAQIAFEQRNVNLAENLVSQDDVIDSLNRQIFQEAVEIGGSDPHAREWAAHVMLIARYLERIGDHTVDIGEQIAFVISGRVPGVHGRVAPERRAGLTSTPTRATPPLIRRRRQPLRAHQPVVVEAERPDAALLQVERLAHVDLVGCREPLDDLVDHAAPGCTRPPRRPAGRGSGSAPPPPPRGREALLRQQRVSVRAATPIDSLSGCTVSTQRT